MACAGVAAQNAKPEKVTLPNGVVFELLKEGTGQSPKGTIDFLKILQKEERLQINRRDPYLTTHPLTPERINAFEQAASQSPYVNTPDTPQNHVCPRCSASTGPCGRQVHCAAAPARQAAWDLVSRDLRGAPFNYDSNTAFIVAN